MNDKPVMNNWFTPVHETMVIKPTIRLIVTSLCNFNCSYPVESGKNKKWCHAEGIQGFDSFRKLEFCPDPDTASLIRLGKILRSLTGISKIRLAGLEPTLRSDITELISGFKSLGFERVGITTNGSLLKGLAKDLVAAGLDEVNVSIHSLDRDTHSKITGVDCLGEVLDGVRLCRELGIRAIKVNCVLLRRERMRSELRDFLKFAAENSVLLRLYQLFWLPSGNSWVEKYQVSWQHFYPLWKPFMRKTSIQSLTLPMRHRITFELTTGAIVEVDTFDQPKSSCPECQSCPYQFSCEEGLFGCGLRVTPDLHLSPCLYRDDLKLDLRPLCDGVSSQLAQERTIMELATRFQNWGVEVSADTVPKQLTIV